MSKLREQIKYIFGLVRASGQEAEDSLVDLLLDTLATPPHKAVNDFSPMGYQQSGGTSPTQLKRMVSDE